MNLLLKETTLSLWHEVIRGAEDRCAVRLNQHLESYLIALLVRYANRPDLAKRLFASAFLEALQQYERYRALSLQEVGDQCLLYAGLFPQQAIKRHVKISYFIDMGRGAYASISKKTNDLYYDLAIEFVLLTDVLQSIRPGNLLPLEAYEQWRETGSQRALNILKSYTNKEAFLIKKQ